jgi:hypothetical protein
MALIVRLPRLLGAYLAASLAAGFALALMLVLWILIEEILPGRESLPPAPRQSLQYLLLVATGLGGITAATHGLVPALIAIVVGEIRAVRSAAFYGFTGIVAAVGTWWMMMLRRGPEPLALALRPEQLLVAAILGVAGLAGGLVYWLIAGRSAGAWRDTEGQPSKR